MAYNDPTLGFQNIATIGNGVVQENVYIDVSNDVSASQTHATHLSTLYGWVGHACFSVGCVSGHMGSPITNMTLCAGPLLEISVGDATVGILTESGKLVYIAWGV